MCAHNSTLEPCGRTISKGGGGEESPGPLAEHSILSNISPEIQDSLSALEVIRSLVSQTHKVLYACAQPAILTQNLCQKSNQTQDSPKMDGFFLAGGTHPSSQ